jgi:hypothetical protein
VTFEIAGLIGPDGHVTGIDMDEDEVKLAYSLDAGIPRPNLRLVQRADVVGEAKTHPLTTIDATSSAIVAAGIASDDQVQAAQASFAAYTADPRTLVGRPRTFQRWSRRDR